jgi:hypothetical protein
VVRLAAATAVSVFVLVGLASGGAAAAPPSATVQSVSYKAGASNIDVVLAVPKGIDNAARHGDADFGFRVTVTYLAADTNVVTIDSGRVSLADTLLVGALDHSTDVVLFKLPLGGNAGPGSTPSYSSTVELLFPSD